MPRLVRRLLEVTLGLLVLGTLTLAIAVAAGPAFGYGVYAVRSASMTPALRVGDLAVEQRVDPTEIQAGDVITVTTRSGSIVTHRVVTVTPNDAGPVFTTRGDANRTPDPVATYAGNVRGRVSAHVPLLGYALALVTTSSGLLALVAIGGSLLLAIWLLGDQEDRRELERLDALARELGIARPVAP